MTGTPALPPSPPPCTSRPHLDSFLRFHWGPHFLRRSGQAGRWGPRGRGRPGVGGGGGGCPARPSPPLLRARPGRSLYAWGARAGAWPLICPRQIVLGGERDSDRMGGPHHFGLLSFQKPLALILNFPPGSLALQGLRAWPTVRAQESLPFVPARQDVSEPSWPFLSPGIPCPPCSLSTSFRARSIQLSSGSFSASLPGSPHFPSPSSMPGCKLGAAAQHTVGSESGGRVNRPAKEYVNRKWQGLQQGSIQEGFPQEVTCKLGQGHASTTWLEQGVQGGASVWGEARAGQAPSSCGGALCQDPARSNPSEDPTDSCKKSPNADPSNFVQLQVCRPLYHLHDIFSFGNPGFAHLFSPPGGLSPSFLPSTLPASQGFPPPGRSPPPLSKSRPFSFQSLGASPLTCQTFSKSGFSSSSGVDQTHALAEDTLRG